MYSVLSTQYCLFGNSETFGSFSIETNGKILFVLLSFHMVTRGYTYLIRLAGKAIRFFKYVYTTVCYHGTLKR